MEIEECLFNDNRGGNSGTVFLHKARGYFSNNTFNANNSGAGTIHVSSTYPQPDITNNIFVGDTEGYGLNYAGAIWGSHGCNLFWNNFEGPISGDVLASTEIEHLPLFCDPLSGDFTISIHSPAAPANNSCNQLMGAFPAECDITSPPGAAPTITSIRDRPRDGGRHVIIEWDASNFDAPGSEIVITRYDIFHRLDPALSASLESSGNSKVMGFQLSSPAFWRRTGTVEASQLPEYDFVATTACDSTAAEGICWSVFYISAISPDPLVFFDSTPDSGYSIGNGGGHRRPDKREFEDPEDGTRPARVELVTVESAVPPMRFELSQNVPNPFNPSTTIMYTIASDAFVDLSIFDVRGECIKTLVKGPHGRNHFRVIWDGKDNTGNSVASGVYFYRLTARKSTRTKKMVLLR